MLPDLSNKTIAIVGLGGSYADFVMARINSEKFDEVWGINCIGAVFHVDRTFMMDPASRFLDDVKAGKQTGIAQEFLYLTEKKGPIYSCCLDERIPEIQLYPLKEVISATNFSYFNNTVAYALAFAVASNVAKLCLYGIDFSYKKNLHFAEAGRACVEFWCAIAATKGVQLEVGPRSPLLDTDVPADEKLYGYHRLDDPLVQVVSEGTLVICKKSESDLYVKEKQRVTSPEPLDGREPVLIGKHDIEGVTYSKESEND